MAIPVRYTPGEQHLEIPDRGRIELDGYGELVTTRSIAEDVSLSSLNTALKRLDHHVGIYGESIDLTFVDVEPQHIDDEVLRNSISLSWSNRTGFVANCVLFTEDEPDVGQLKAAATPVLDRYRGEFVSIRPDSQKGDWITFVAAKAPTRGKTVGDLIGFIERIEAATQITVSGPVDPASVLHLVRTGMSDLLVGRSEGEWFDAKAAPYRLDQDIACYELAKDVAAFANHRGGVIVIGAKTKRTPNGEEIRKINGCLEPDFSIRRQQNIIRDRVFPAVVDVTLEWVPNRQGERGVGLIAVPNQPERNKPFLVKGSADSGPGLTFGWPRREGDGAAGFPIESLHALIKAGQYVFAAQTAEAQVENLQRELDHFRDSSVPLFLSGIPPAARQAGFSITHQPDEVIFEKEGADPLIVSRDTLGPPADLGQREDVLKKLSERGLPVRRLPSGYLAPRNAS